MDTVYYVVKQMDCPECNGNGLISHPLWYLFWDEWYNDPDNDRDPEPSDIEWWFKNIANCDPPDETITCRECDGKCVISREVDLSEVTQPLENRIAAIERALVRLAYEVNP